MNMGVDRACGDNQPFSGNRFCRWTNNNIDTSLNIVSFGTSHDDEIYVLAFNAEQLYALRPETRNHSVIE